jgi:ferredoxin
MTGLSGPRPRASIRARGRPVEDPGCAGCAHLGTLWALRRAGIDARGALGCEPAAPEDRGPGRWAAVVGAGALRGDGASRLVAGAAGAGARFVVVADRAEARGAAGAAAALAAAGAPVRAFHPGRLADARAAVEWASRAGPVAALVAVAPCARAAPRGGPLAIAPSRCNRCGACLGLGCPAISDPGAEALAIDPGVCTGCGACAGLCRAGAISAARSR